MTPEDKDQITDSIVEAFDQMAEEGAKEGNIEEGTIEEPKEPPAPDLEEPLPPKEEPEEEPEPEAEEEIEVKAEVETPEEPEPSEPEEPEESEEPEGPEPESEYPPDVQAFLDRHGGDLGKALQSAAEQYRMIGERNRAHGEMTRRVAQLEAELAAAQSFTGGLGLAPEQVEWIEQAVQSEQPGAYVQSAVAAGEYDLARAVCDAWGQEGDAYSALRTRQMVDEAEQYAQQAQIAAEPPPAISRDDLYGLIQEQVPDFGNYWNEMTEIVTQLGQQHPMVIAANSQDPNEAASGLIDIYQVARTRRARVAEARQQVEQQNEEQELAKRRASHVSSASSRSASEEPPRTTRIAPGLTLEELDAALAAE